MSVQTSRARLTQLGDLVIPPDALPAILEEFAQYDRALEGLTPFAEATPWIAACGGLTEAGMVRAAPRAPERSPAAPAAAATAGAPWELGAAELGARLAARELSALEAVDAVLARLDALEPRLNAFVTVCAEQARDAARRADEELARGERRGPLHGVPVSVKDLFATAGVRTTGGSKILADWVPDADAAIVERLRAAGAVVVGKTNLDEFGHGGTSTQSHFGPVHNPWHTDRVAGGSSGGSAAAVAAGVAPISYGTETGSSVRRPSAYCGVVGLKPTFGLVSRHGSFRGAWTLDHVGVFARSVEDAVLALDAVLGYDPRDPASLPPPAAGWAAHLAPRAADVRVGVPRQLLDECSDATVRATFDGALAVLADLGARLVDVELPELAYVAATSMLTSNAESSANNTRWLRECPGDYQPGIGRRLMAGLGLTAADYLTAQRARHRIDVAVHEAFRTFDVLATPTTLRSAPPLAAGAAGNGDEPYRIAVTQSSMLRLPSLLGLPGCSLPSGFADDGLPLGLQLVGARLTDQLVWDVALAYTQATTWTLARPLLP